MNSIIFLNHGAGGKEETRRQVRSRAALHSHRIGPRKPKSRSSKPRNTEPGQANGTGGGRPSISRRKSSISAAISAPREVLVRQQMSENYEDDGNVSPWTPSPIITPPIHGIGSYADDPFDTYPVPAQAWFPETLNYMWHFIQRGWCALPTTAQERECAMLWVQRLTMQDPTYFYMNMLSVMGDLVSSGHRSPDCMVWLAGQVVAAINRALGDTSTALAIGTILTVGRLALREIVVGDRKAGSACHRPAFARMVVMAGGVEALRLPPLVRGHLAWADRVMTSMTGVKMAVLEPGLRDEMIFDGPGGSSADDEKVIDEYIPCRAALREIQSSFRLDQEGQQ